MPAHDHAAFELLPIPLLVANKAQVLFANRAFGEFFGVAPESVVGLAPTEMIAKVADPSDLGWLQALLVDRDRNAPPPSFWTLVRTATGRQFRIHVRTLRLSPSNHDVFLMAESDSDLAVADLTGALVRAAGQLVHLHDEDALLATAADALYGQGLMVTLKPLHPHSAGAALVRLPPEAAAELMALRGSPESPLPWPGLLEERIALLVRGGRTVFWQDTHAEIEKLLPQPLAGRIGKALPRRSVLLPILVEGEPWALLAVHGDSLTPSSAATINLFARHLGSALENARHHTQASARMNKVVQLQRELVERERLAAVGEAAAVLSHEMRNPLGAILNAVAMLKRAPRLAQTSASLVAIVEQEASDLDALVNDLLQFARPLEPRRRRLDLRELAQAAVTRARAQTGDGVEFELVCSGCEDFEADPTLMEIAVENLLRNAVQVSPPRGRIRLLLGTSPEGAMVAVEDEGPCVPDADGPRVFEPFFANRAAGTGLGLAVVKRVAEAHGGTVRVASGSLGGARFELVLPPAD